MTTTTDPGALDDLAAELDDTDDPQGDDRGADPPTDPTYYAGTVTTGPPPYPGRQLVSRYPAGVLLVDKPGERAWVLDYDPATRTYRCRVTAGVPLDPAGRWRAAEGDDYDVRAFDPAFDGDDPPGSCTEPGCDDAGGASA